jgi:hypothetical protein
MDHQLTPPLRPKPQSGAALIVTLTLLLLITGLAISLFMTANTELQSASQFKNSQGLTELSDICVNLVMGQIKDATTTNAAGTPANRLTWASQPGMIRTYGSSTNAAISYKLYSWDSPRVSGDDTTTVPTTWFSTPAQYTDLNAPIPNSTNSTNTDLYRYPIAYPTGSTAALGYTVSGAPVGAVSGETIVNSVPMPVQWLYVLKDGTMVYPTSATGNNATISGASAANPIVARVAYWTDDETSKVNINTAAGGPFWMTPVFATSVGQSSGNSNAYYQPMQLEFQRYPGHPARTDLRAVFPDLTSTNSIDSLYAFAPRIQFGGSMAAMAAGFNIATNTNSVRMDSDRLFASVGEARFSSTNSPNNRTDFPASGGNWTDRIERNKFLITASSRAPEITLYGTPRISIWPESANAATNVRTPYDALIAFCASLPGSGGTTNNYYFDRTNALSATTDIGRVRNAQLLGYLDSLMNTTAIPASGSGGFVAKGSAADLAQIQTEIYDYIRCVNLTDTHPNVGNVSYSLGCIVVPAERASGGVTTRGFGRFYTLNQFGLIFAATADFTNTISNVRENKSLQSSPGTNNATLLTINQTKVMALPVFELGVCSPGSGGVRTDQVLGGVTLRVRNLDAISVNSTPLGLTNLWNRGSSLPGSYDYNWSARFFENGTGGYLFHTTPIRNLIGFNALQNVNGFNGTSTNYPISQAFTVTTGSNMTVSSSTNIFVDIITSGATNTITIPPFNGTVSAPSLDSSQNAWAFHAEGIGTNASGLSGTNGRMSSISTNAPSYGLIYTNDSVFALNTRHGDYRMVMANPAGGSSNFSVVSINPTNSRMAHRFFTPRNGGYTPSVNIETNYLGIMPPLSGNQRYMPMLPSATNWPSGVAKPSDWGDFDNGYPLVPDGAYINKPDEGEIDLSNGLPYFGQTKGQSAQAAAVTGWGGATALGVFAWSSPNREIASPVAFGSLPSAALQGRPWQNLLFRPAPSSTNTSITANNGLHPGAAGMKWDGTSDSTAPPDHYLLDYFWMPVVEPWAVSERFSTAGKLNMNYEIAPFSYIKRETSIHALLYTEIVPSVPGFRAPSGTPVAPNYSFGISTGGYSKSSAGGEVRPTNGIVIERECNVPETLKAISYRRGANRLFTTPSQICEVFLVPKGVNQATNSGSAPTFSTNSGRVLDFDGTTEFWSKNRMTGDNLRELPYNNIYPRLTTKSNTYTVHYRVQMLKKLPGGDQSTWDESKDKVASELRGSTLIERFLDPNATYPDYATAFSTSASLETLYRFRVLQRSQFTP